MKSFKQNYFFFGSIFLAKQNFKSQNQLCNVEKSISWECEEKNTEKKKIIFFSVHKKKRKEKKVKKENFFFLSSGWKKYKNYTQKKYKEKNLCEKIMLILKEKMDAQEIN